MASTNLCNSCSFLLSEPCYSGDVISLSSLKSSHWTRCRSLLAVSRCSNLSNKVLHLGASRGHPAPISRQPQFTKSKWKNWFLSTEIGLNKWASDGDRGRGERWDHTPSSNLAACLLLNRRRIDSASQLHDWRSVSEGWSKVELGLWP